MFIREGRVVILSKKKVMNNMTDIVSRLSPDSVDELKEHYKKTGGRKKWGSQSKFVLAAVKFFTTHECEARLSTDPRGAIVSIEKELKENGGNVFEVMARKKNAVEKAQNLLEKARVEFRRYLLEHEKDFSAVYEIIAESKKKEERDERASDEYREGRERGMKMAKQDLEAIRDG